MVKMPGRGKTLDDMAGKPTRDPALNHQEQLDTGKAGNDMGVVEADDSADDPEQVVRVQILGEGHFLNSHPIPVNAVVEMTEADIDLHRAQGYQIGPVPDDYDGEVYDYSEPWENPKNEKAA